MTAHSAHQGNIRNLFTHWSRLNSRDGTGDREALEQLLRAPACRPPLSPEPFERFTRMDHKRPDKQGSGLGLSIVRGLARSNGVTRGTSRVSHMVPASGPATGRPEGVTSLRGRRSDPAV